MTISPTITPFLWFNNQAEEATKFYTTVFKNSKVINSGPMMSVFELEGQQFFALNAGPQFKFTEAISFFVAVGTQEEIDYYWESFTADGGEESQCGWLKDKYGLSWQIVPNVLGKLMSNPDSSKSTAVMQALLKMHKIIIADLEKAAE